jgi:hypothetical protein
MADVQCWRSKIQGEMLPNFFKVLSGYLGTLRTFQVRRGPRPNPKDPQGPPEEPPDGGKLVLENT